MCTRLGLRETRVALAKYFFLAPYQLLFGLCIYLEKGYSLTSSLSYHAYYQAINICIDSLLGWHRHISLKYTLELGDILVIKLTTKKRLLITKKDTHNNIYPRTHPCHITRDKMSLDSLAKLEVE
jgi:hypothetical protein